MASVVRAPSAKLTCPVPGPGFRPREQVRRALQDRRVWVEAPAGFGKTCHAAHAVREMQARDGTPYAWLSLDPGDTDPATLLRSLVAAAGLAWPGLPLPLSPRLEVAPAALFDAGQRLAALLAPLGPFTIVLDDVHRLDGDGGAAVSVLEALIQGAPPDVRLILIGQSPPRGLPVLKWRDEGRLTWVGTDELRMRPADVKRLLAAEVGRVAADVPSRIAEATGGWPLVVRLVAQHLAGQRRAEWDLEALGAQGEALHRHLAGEILGRLPPDEQAFLVAASLADQVDPTVAEVLVPGQGGQLYGRVVRAPWFTPLGPGGGPARLHPVLRSFLRGEADRKLGPSGLGAVHRRLSAHHAGSRDLARGVDHALAAGDWAAAAAMLERASAEETAMGRTARVRAWVDSYPPDVARETAPVLLARARVAALVGDHEEAFRVAEAARLRYLAQGCVDGAVSCLDLCAVDLELAPSDAVLRAARGARASEVPVVAAWARLWLRKLAAAGGADEPEDEIGAAVEAVEREAPLDPHTPRARILGDHLRYLAGRVGEIRCTAGQMVASLTAQQFDYWPALVYAGRWDELEALLDEAGSVPTPAWARDFVAAWLKLPRAVLLALRGDPERALALARDVERALAPGTLASPHWPLELSVLRAVKTGCLVRAVALDAAEREARANQAALATSPTMAPVGHLDLARVLLCGGRAIEAEAELEAAGALRADRGLRGLYYRTLSMALRLARGGPDGERDRLVALLAEIDRAGAYGLVPHYDPGPLRGALRSLDTASLPCGLAAAAMRIEALYAREGAPAAMAAAPAARLATLGGLVWQVPGNDVARLPSRRVAELLLRLLWADGASLSREILAEAMWPEAAAVDQMNRLRVTLHDLRRWLATGDGATGAAVVADRASVRLADAGALGWDVTSMRAHVRGARRAHDGRDREGLVRHSAAALELYRGPFLPEPAWYEAFLYERRELERQHLAFTQWCAGAIGLDHARMPALLERAVRANPAEEALARLWLESLVRQGRRPEARRALGVCAALLDAHVGTPPPDDWLRLVDGAE